MSRISLSRSLAVRTKHNLLSSIVASRVTIALSQRFGGFPALQIGNLYWIWGFTKNQFGFFRVKAGKTKNGICNVSGFNIGKAAILREMPIGFLRPTHI
jgi:hypothetical protein